MITREEQEIISKEAPLPSYIVEMLNLNTRYQIAVVDEIQMITDPQRGSGWTSAVLALLKDTGDEVMIRKYKRPSQSGRKEFGGGFGQG